MAGDEGFCSHFKQNMSKLLYEFIGTALFTMVFIGQAVGSSMLLSLWILTVFCWKISGSHFNPAVSLAYILRKETGGLPRMLCLCYMVA